MSDASERRVRPSPGQEPSEGAPAVPGQRDDKDVDDPFGADEPD